MGFSQEKTTTQKISIENQCKSNNTKKSIENQCKCDFPEILPTGKKNHKILP